MSKVYAKKGAETVGELIELLSTIPKDYTVSVCGISDFSIAVYDNEKGILLDDSNWIEENVESSTEMS